MRYNALELYNEDHEHTAHTDNWTMGITVLEVLIGAPVYESLMNHEYGAENTQHLLQLAAASQDRKSYWQKEKYGDQMPEMRT